MNAYERFWNKVDKIPDGCWLWNGAKSDKGYGNFYLTNKPKRKAVLAHRYAYLMLVGRIPDGKELDHLCRVRHCVNPDHLEPVTHKENVQRGEKAQRTKCIHGHEFTPENTIIRKNGTRRCRSCENKRRKKYPSYGKAA